MVKLDLAACTLGQYGWPGIAPVGFRDTQLDAEGPPLEAARIGAAYLLCPGSDTIDGARSWHVRHDLHVAFLS